MENPAQPQAIDLDREQSRQLTEACNGEFGRIFVVAGRDTFPGDPARWRLWLVPSTARGVNAAIKRLAPPHEASSER